MYTKIEFKSEKLKKEVDEFLKREKENQEEDNIKNLGIFEKKGNIYYSNLPLIEILFKMCKEFDQVVTSTAMFRNFALLNKDGSQNEDTPINLYGRQVWANAFLAEYKNKAHEWINSF